MLISITFLLLFCTPSALSSGSRIVGGTETTIENRPFQALVQLDGTFYCGGAIISSLHILTAGHCLFLELQRYSFRVGSASRLTGGQVIAPVDLILHTQYHPPNADFDAGLVVLERRILFSTEAKPIRLAFYDESVPDGAEAVVSGWGDTHNNYSYPEFLHEVSVPIVNQKLCKRIYTDLTRNMICAGIVTKDSCGGDSGGPLTFNDVHIGVVSFGAAQCGISGYPGVYTRTSSIRPWIDSLLRSHFSAPFGEHQIEI